MSTEWNKLYINWLEKLAALHEESEKHNFTPEGEAAYEIAFQQAKQAYHLLCEHDAQRIDAKLKELGA